MLFESLAIVTQIGSGEILLESLAAVTLTGSGDNFIQEFKIVVSQVNLTPEDQLREYFLPNLHALCKKNGNPIGVHVRFRFAPPRLRLLVLIKKTF